MRLSVRWITGNEPEFRGRTLAIITPGRRDEISVPDNLFLCDFCNDEIRVRPLAVVDGNAVCPKCAEQVYGIGRYEPSVAWVEVPND